MEQIFYRFFLYILPIGTIFAVIVLVFFRNSKQLRWLERQKTLLGVVNSLASLATILSLWIALGAYYHGEYTQKERTRQEHQGLVNNFMLEMKLNKSYANNFLELGADGILKKKYPYWSLQTGILDQMLRLDIFSENTSWGLVDLHSMLIQHNKMLEFIRNPTVFADRGWPGFAGSNVDVWLDSAKKILKKYDEIEIALKKETIR